MAASSGVAVDATFSFASPFPAAKDRSFPLVHNTIPIRTADENRFMRISPAATAPFRSDPYDAQFVTKNLTNSWRAPFSDGRGPQETPAENRLIVGNTRSRSEASCFPQRHQSSIVMKTLFGSFT